MAFVESLADYFNEFGLEATWQAQTIKAIFDNAYQEEFGIARVNPYVTVMESQMAGVARGQSITVASVAYVIRNIVPDGTGILQLELEKA